MRLVLFQRPVLPAASIVGLVRDPHLLGALGNGYAFALQLLDLPEFGDDLLHRMFGSRHESPHLVLGFHALTTYDLDQSKGGRTS